MKFQSTLPARGATGSDSYRRRAGGDFNPRSPHGERRQGARHSGAPHYFNPRSPHGERQKMANVMTRISLFQSTLPARGATLESLAHNDNDDISIHAPRTGSDITALEAAERLGLFQSTLPARGATTSRSLQNASFSFQSTLPARGATPGFPASDTSTAPFQSTLPARGATRPASRFWGWRRHFNPRSPHGERRRAEARQELDGAISIHAPRTGSDGRISSERCVEHDFNPRSPHGERPAIRRSPGR